MPKKSDFFWLSWHFEMIKISLCEGHHIWESVNSNRTCGGGCNYVHHDDLLSSHSTNGGKYYEKKIGQGVNSFIWCISVVVCCRYTIFVFIHFRHRYS